MNPKGKRGISFRKIERRIKDRLLSWIVAAMQPRQPLPLPDWASGRHRILVLRYDRIGDMVLSTGIIKAIALAQPTIEIDVLASVQNSVVLEGNPHVADVMTVDRRRPWSWIAAIMRMRRRRYDAVIDVMVMAPSLTTTLVMWVSGSRHRIGLGDRGNQGALTVPVARIQDAVHYVDHSAALLAAFGVDPLALKGQQVRRVDGPPSPVLRGIGGWGIWRPEIFLSAAEIAQGEGQWRRGAAGAPADEPAAGRLVVNVSAGGAWRYWPIASFTEALTVIRAKFPRLECMLIGAPDDLGLMNALSRASGASVAYTARAREMMAIVATSDVVFTADTSVTHIASAFGKPILAMFARSKADLWGPYDVPGGVVSTAAASIDALDVASVLPALIEVIKLAIPI